MCCWSVLKTIGFQVVEVKEEVWSPYCTPAAHVQNGCQGKGSAFSVMGGTDPLNGTLPTLPVHCHSSLSYCEAKWVGQLTVIFIQVAYFEKMTHRGNILSKTNFLRRMLWQNSNIPRIEISSIMRVPGACLMFLRYQVTPAASSGRMCTYQSSEQFVLCSPIHACLNAAWLDDRTGDPVGNVTDGSSIGELML